MSEEYLTGYPTNDYRDYIEHSAGPWKKHKYIAKRDGRYIYPEDITGAKRNIGIARGRFHRDGGYRKPLSISDLSTNAERARDDYRFYKSSRYLRKKFPNKLDALSYPIVDAKVPKRKKTKVETGASGALRALGFERAADSIEKQNKLDHRVSKSKMNKNREKVLKWRRNKKLADEDRNTRLVQREVDEMARKRNKKG